MHSTEVILPTVAAVIAGGITTACILYRTSPDELYSKAKRWLARQQTDNTEEEDGQLWPAEGFAGPPRCRPLSTIGELLTWKPPATEAAAGQGQLTAADPCSCTTPLDTPLDITLQSSASAVPLVTVATAGGGGRAIAVTTATAADAIRTPALISRPQLLVCHDMMGGYLPQDSLLAGGSVPGQYRLWHWDCVDVFVYFSHHMVTIPPKGWIHAAHKHGVKVLGTFITEFGQGKRRCNRLFSSNQSAETVADQLVAVAGHYGFEGWLVNIENGLSQAQVAVMQHFVGYLRARMRAVVPHAVVVWYDAVTTAGKLDWQNKLSPLNGPFFDLSDALFINYTWTPTTLPETAAAAASRKPEVYMGVDVHGRGSYGGGGHNVGLALKAAAAEGLSAALFAPGWVFENLERSRFAELQEQWWTKVQADWGFSHAVIHSLPFIGSFNAGAGTGWFQAGALIASGAMAATAAAAAAGCATAETAAAGGGDDNDDAGWFNMLLTDTLPTSRDPVGQQVVCGPVVGRLTSSTAYTGGSCLALIKQQQQERTSSTDAAGQIAPAVGSTALVAAAAQAPCCSFPMAAAAAGPAGGGSGGVAGKEFVLLQLFGADIHVPQDTVVEVSCIYATPDSSSSSVGPHAPCLWVMTKAAREQGVINLPAADCYHHHQQQLMLADGQSSGVSVALLPAQAGSSAAAEEQVLGPVRFVSRSSKSSSNGGSSNLWEADLAALLAAGWQWKRSTWLLPLQAGSSISSIGVAVQLHGTGGLSEAAEGSILGLLGEVQLCISGHDDDEVPSASRSP